VNHNHEQQRQKWITYLRERDAYVLDVGAHVPSWGIPGSPILNAWLAARLAARREADRVRH